MKNQKDITEIKIKIRLQSLTVFLLLSVLFVFTQTASAQNEPDVIDQPYKINGKEVKEYLIEKYQLHKIHKDDLTSILQQTPYGPSGKLHINSFEKPITPQNVVITDASVQGRARAIAQAFLEEEASLFGITNMEEIREIRVNAIKGDRGGVTSVHYRRYINNLELENMYIRITVGPEDTITNMDANLVAPPPELYQAVKKKILSEAEIRRIVEQDLESAGVDSKDMRVLSIEKAAIPSPPHVVWKVDINLKKSGGRWKYRIDAFTGEVLEKRDALIIN
jgi:hypothetical protein